MAYTKTTWVNDEPPDIDADNLNKMEQGIYDAQFPDGGTEGQLLARTATGRGWVDPPNSAVWGGITGDIGDQTDLQALLSTKMTTPSGGTTGQVLTKTASGYDWQTGGSGGTWGSITGTLSDQTDLQNALDAKSNIGNIATIETSPATAIHAEGSYIVWNGQLYEVTASIAVGETLTVGTNITAKTVGGELTTLKNGLTNVETGINELHTSGYVPVMTTFSQSGTAVDYTIPSTGLYAVRASTGSTAGTLSVYMFNNAGNPIATVINVNAPAWATIFTPPIPLIAGTIIKAQFDGPNGSGGAIVKYAV